MALLMFFLFGLTLAKDCIENNPNTIWYGDSRSDTRVDQRSRDLPASVKMNVDGQNGGGVIAQFSQRFGSDAYMAHGRKRIVYAGVNDCNLAAAFFDSTSSSMTKTEVFSTAYDALLNKKFYWAPPQIGSSASYSQLTGTFGGVATMVISTTAATDFMIEKPTTAGLFMVCHLVTGGTVGGVTLNTGVHCGWFKTGVTLVNVIGTLYLSEVMHIGNTVGKGLLIKSFGNGATCAELQNVWVEQGAWEVPNNNGIYPTDGFNNMHGSASIRAQINSWLSCEGVDWEQYGDGYCTDCEFRTNLTAFKSQVDADLSSTATEFYQLVQKESSSIVTLVRQASNKTADELNKKEQAIRAEFETFKQSLNISSLVATEKAEMKKILEDQIAKFTSQVQEKADQLSALAWIGVAGLAVAGASLLLGFILIGIKLHKHLVETGRVSGGCCYH